MAKNKTRTNTRSVIWRIHGSHLLKLIFLFLITDGFIFWLLLPSDIASGVRSTITRDELLSIFKRARPFLTFQMAFLVYNLLFGAAKLYRLMRPLTNLVEATTALSREKSSEELYRQLESAISRISPFESKDTVHTGNSELAGLESAVNSLLSRMRETYGHQARFVSDASHELRTPISVIQGYADMLDRWGKDDPKVLSEAITAIKSEAEHMHRLVEQLLFLARGDSGRNPLSVTEFSISDVLRDAAHEYEMISPERTWILKMPENNVMMKGDEGMIKQTVRIFCDNAVKYSPAGTQITVALSESERRVTVSVQDEGPGISPEDCAHVLERFYRADSARTRSTGGNGLGLSIADWIVSQHGGRIDILSREGIGTRVSAIFNK